jgi:hypothetical protein
MRVGWLPLSDTELVAKNNGVIPEHLWLSAWMNAIGAGAPTASRSPVTTANEAGCLRARLLFCHYNRLHR